jgi:hypothetical protein
MGNYQEIIPNASKKSSPLMLKYVKNGPLLISYLKAQIIVLTPKSATPNSNLQNIYESK